jgi:hypothetical protein
MRIRARKRINMFLCIGDPFFGTLDCNMHGILYIDMSFPALNLQQKQESPGGGYMTLLDWNNKNSDR